MKGPVKKENSVTLIYGNEVETMVESLLADVAALDSLRPCDSVLIKPNLVVSRPDWIGVDTDPRVIEALVKGLKERGINRITVGDGSGMGYSTTKAFEICGYKDLAVRYGLYLIDFERDQFVNKPVPIDGPFKHLEIARAVIESDFLINVPVMKAHMETLITCSLKNLKGVMPRAMKSAFHGVDLHRAIAQLNSVVSPDLILVDGLQGDLSSETGRTPVTMERIFLGSNPVAVDSVVADTLGYAPRTIRHIAYSADAGLGPCELDRINIRHLNRPTMHVSFSPPRHFSKRFPCSIHAEGACCTCIGNLIFALERLQERRLLSRDLNIVVGQKSRFSAPEGEVTVAVGQCAVKHNRADICIDQCPPTAGTIYQRVASAFSGGKNRD